MRRLGWLLLTVPAIFLLAQDKQPKTEKLAPYYPTPESVVEKMLRLGELKAGEKMYDLGSGDGRIVIAAARKFKANAWGVEFDEPLVKAEPGAHLEAGTVRIGAHYSRRSATAGLLDRRSAHRVPVAYVE
jgi:predicted RNA methylase